MFDTVFWKKQCENLMEEEFINKSLWVTVTMLLLWCLLKKSQILERK
jgi:hypothetical protein